MILELRRHVVLAGYRRRSLLPAPCDAYLIIQTIEIFSHLPPSCAGASQVEKIQIHTFTSCPSPVQDGDR